MTAKLLFDHVPENGRAGLLNSLIANLQSSDRPSLELVASLVVSHVDQSIRRDFVLRLEDVIRDGEVQNAVAICLQYATLGNEVLQRVAEHLSKAKSTAPEQRQSDDAVQSYLLFAQSVFSHLSIADAHNVIFSSCLDFLLSEDAGVVECSKALVFAFLGTKNKSIMEDIILPAQLPIWNCIQSLVAPCANKRSTLLGYALWLRWIVSTTQPQLESVVTTKYWQLLALGLRQRDPERRKLCLSILRLTTAADSMLVSQSESKQYQRYCTVFETIVLGRYINQIQECEKDLDLLTTASSLHPQWLYTLLASAIDSHMQESNRKFVGNWVMRSIFKHTPDFSQFFLVDFLPWAIQGSLFVSSLKWQTGKRRCIHGDRLSQYIKTVVIDAEMRHELTNGIVEMVLNKKDYMFAYATVYLLEGLRGALSEGHLQMLAHLTNMPEVARDFIKVLTTSGSELHMNENSISRRGVIEQEAIERAKMFDQNVQDIEAIWDDLDRLEYPKGLLLIMPGIILSPSTVSYATTDPELRASIVEKLRVLLDVANTKVFLFPALMATLRSTVLTTLHIIEALDAEDMLISVAEHQPSPTVDLMLEEATLHLTPFSYKDYFGEPPSYGFAAYLDFVSRLQDNQRVVHGILYRLLQPWKEQKVPPPTVSSWKSTLQLQVLLLCLEQFQSDPNGQAQALLDDLFHVLAIEPLPRYRYLLEWIIVRYLIRHNMEDTLLSRASSKDHHSNPKHLASLMKIGTILACRQASGERFAMQLATSFVPLAASSKIVIRHEAQWQIPVLMDQARLRAWTNITINPAFSALDDYIRSLERFHEPPLERQIGRFDPEKDHTLTNLVEGPWFDLDHIGAPLTSRADFVRLYDADKAVDKTQSCMPLGDELIRPTAPDDNTIQDNDKEASLGPRTVHEASALQTKGAAYLARALADPSLHQARSNDIIVVASFVENPYNLGGLSRVSEIFGAASLCLQNQNVVSNKDFTSVSVSSHLHFPIVQLSAPDVLDFVAARKSDGFSIVGIEQTDRSLVLGSEDTKLPQKVVLVVGSEREGMPAIVLTECDVLVEIPQQGITRSLNVQTAVSIVLYEHSRQHRIAL